MRRSEAIHKLDILGHLGLTSPHKVIPEFAESKQNDKLFICKRTSENAKADDIELLAITNDREHEEMIKLQQNMREGAKRQAIIEAHRATTMQEIIKGLRERFSETNMFLQSCDEKRKGALKTVCDEKKLHSELKEEHIKLSEGIEVMTKFRDELAKVVKDLEVYEGVIEEAVAVNKNWNTTKDCIKRCDAMLMAHDEIIKMKDETLTKIENMRKKLARMTSKAAMAILGLDTTLNELERTLVAAQENCRYWDNALVNVKNCIRDNECTKMILSQSIDAMYRMLCRWRNVAPQHGSNIEIQLSFIQDEFHILTGVLNECTKKPSKKICSFKK